MRLYALPSWRLVRQVVLDLVVLCWLVGWWVLGRYADDLVRAIAAPLHRAAGQGTGIEQNLSEAARQAGRVPVVGDGLRRPFDNLAGSVDDLAAFAGQQAASLDESATAIGWLVFLAPVLGLLAVWLPHRVRFAVRARDTLALAGHPDGTDLLALRALATQPLRRLQQVTPEPVAGWRAGDPAVVEGLAELERVRAGIARPPR